MFCCFDEILRDLRLQNVEKLIMSLHPGGFFPPPKRNVKSHEKLHPAILEAPKRSDLRCYIVEGTARLTGVRRKDPWSFLPRGWLLWKLSVSENDVNLDVWLFAFGFPKCRNKHMIKTTCTMHIAL